MSNQTAAVSTTGVSTTGVSTTGVSTTGVSTEQVSEYIRSHWDDSVRSGITESHVEPIPFPHTTPCIAGHFIALFYWDTYFANIGLLLQNRVELARSNCDAMIYLVNKKGLMPNSTFVGDDTRSQPPYLSLMVREVYERTRDREWLAGAVQALEIEYSFWMEKRITPLGLNRHFHNADREYLLNFYKGALVGRLKKDPDLPEEQRLEIAANYLGEAETGWDFNPRFNGRCGDFAQVELNSNLYLYETNFAWFMRELGRDSEIAQWEQRATQRKTLMEKYLWHEASGTFRDYDFVNNTHSTVPSLGTFHPLWTGWCSPEHAARVREALPQFEFEYGISVCAPQPRDETYQWDYPNGWPPLFWTTISGLNRYGFAADAQRIAQKYVDLCLTNFAHNGQLWEKFDVTTGEVAGGEYDAQPMLGWSAGVFLACCELLKNAPNAA